MHPEACFAAVRPKCRHDDHGLCRMLHGPIRVGTRKRARLTLMLAGDALEGSILSSHYVLRTDKRNGANIGSYGWRDLKGQL